MFTLFLFCAVIAGTIFLLQFVMLLVGFGAEGADFDTDVPDDVSGEFDAGGDYDSGGDYDDGVHDHGSSWLFGVISMRTVVASVTFFGLAGMATMSAGQGPFIALAVAIAGGACAMFVVHFLMRSLHKLGQDGKLRIHHAVGREATVYIPIPAHNEGTGKVQIRMQGRLVELLAMCGTNDDLKTGAKVRVIGVVGGSTVRVQPISAKDMAEAGAVS